MDLSKLSPAPWSYDRDQPTDGTTIVGGDGKEVLGCSEWMRLDDEDGEFIALARNAFDVMMRRNWWAVPRLPGWIIRTPDDVPQLDRHIDEIHSWPDPFTALVEADKWYRENVEK